MKYEKIEHRIEKMVDSKLRQRDEHPHLAALMDLRKIEDLLGEDFFSEES